MTSKLEQTNVRKSPSTRLKAIASQSNSNTDIDTFSAKMILQKIADKVGHKSLVSILISAPLKPICAIKEDSTEILHTQSFADIWKIVGDPLERCDKEKLCKKIVRALESRYENQLVLNDLRSILDPYYNHLRKDDKLQEAGNLDTHVKLTNSPPTLSQDIGQEYAGTSPTRKPPHNGIDTSRTLKPRQDCMDGSYNSKPPQDAIPIQHNYAGIDPTYKPSEDVSSIHKSPIDASQPIQHRPQQDHDMIVNISHAHNPWQDCPNASPVRKLQLDHSISSIKFTLQQNDDDLRFSIKPQQEGLTTNSNSNVGAENGPEPPINSSESLEDHDQLHYCRSFFARPPTPGSKDIESDSTDSCSD